MYFGQACYVFVVFINFFFFINPYSQVQLLCSLLHSKATMMWWSSSLNLEPPLNLRIRWDEESGFVCWFILTVKGVVSSLFEMYSSSSKMIKKISSLEHFLNSVSSTIYFENTNLWKYLLMLLGLNGIIWSEISPLMVRSIFPLKTFYNTRRRDLFVHVR